METTKDSEKTKKRDLMEEDKEVTPVSVNVIFQTIHWFFFYSFFIGYFKSVKLTDNVGKLKDIKGVLNDDSLLNNCRGVIKS